MAKARSGRLSASDRRTSAQRVYTAVGWALEHLAWLPSVLGGLATVVSAVAFVFVVAPNGDIRLGWLLIGIVSAVLSLVMTVTIDRWRRQNKNGLTAERVQLQLTMNDAIAPIVRDIQRMSIQDSSFRLRTLEKIIGHVGAAVPILLPEVRRLRVVVYRVEESRGRKKRRLIVANSVGRKDSPRPFVDGDNGRGSAVFVWLSQGESLFVADLHETRLPGWEGSGKGYKTFISVPLIANEAVYGMLTVDAPTPGDLDEADKPIAEVLAELLAAAFAFSQRA